MVLGYAGHADPAGALAPAVERLAERVPVVARVCGTPGDPQDADAQSQRLRDAGAIVAPSNAAAARLAARAVALTEARRRIAMLTYSVKPRGGVVHSIAVAEALESRGHAVDCLPSAVPARPSSASRRCRRT